MNQIAYLERLDAILTEMASLLLPASRQRPWLKLRIYCGQVNLGRDSVRRYRLLAPDGSVASMATDDVFAIDQRLDELAREHVTLSASLGQPAWFMLRMKVDHGTGQFSVDFTYRDDPYIDDLIEDPSKSDLF